jgi:hypothetical protein
MITSEDHISEYIGTLAGIFANKRLLISSPKEVYTHNLIHFSLFLPLLST